METATESPAALVVLYGCHSVHGRDTKVIKQEILFLVLVLLHFSHLFFFLSQFLKPESTTKFGSFSYFFSFLFAPNDVFIDFRKRERALVGLTQCIECWPED